MAILSRGTSPNCDLAIRRSRANLNPGINNALAKSIASPLHHLVQATQHKPCRGEITATAGARHQSTVRPPTRNSMAVQSGERQALRVMGMKTKCFAHVDTLRINISCPHQKFSFLAPPQCHSSGTEVDAKKSDLLKQSTANRKTCTEWSRLTFSE